ncbi:hypothetical protein N2152v2_010973 [Parachlorella kessleri]
MEASSNLPAVPAAAAVRPTGAQAAFRDQLMGHGKGQMNLAALRSRAEEVKRSIDRMIQALQFAADRLQWSDALEQFSVLNVQHQYLVDQLRPLLKHWVVHPRSVNQSNAALLPIMLATKLLPEMEEEEAALLEGQRHQLGDMDIAGQLLAVGEQTELFNRALDALTQHTPQSQGLLDPKGPRRKELAAALARAAPTAGPSASGQGAAGAGRPPQGMGPGQQGAAGGASKLEGPELLLAAVSYGAGL